MCSIGLLLVWLVLSKMRGFYTCPCPILISIICCIFILQASPHATPLWISHWAHQGFSHGKYSFFLLQRLGQYPYIYWKSANWPGRAPTFLKWIKGHKEIEGNKAADRRAGLGQSKLDNSDIIDLTIPDNIWISGAKLNKLTQALAAMNSSSLSTCFYQGRDY